MGRVWLGSDRRDGSRVAVKILNPQFSRDPTFRQRFEREAHVATLLKSPYTVQTFAFGREQGSYYLVMEFVQGDSVEKMISKGPLPLDEALEIATDTARALEAAAAHKIVHRDLKPSNIIVSPDGAAKLVDFGIAGQANVQDSAGAFIGTVQYAPPEQQRGQVDERTDIYALGATLFHMLAGRPPYLGRTNDDILQQHLHAPFPAPLLALQPEPVVDVVRRCMQKDPEDRYHSAADLAAALDRVRMRIVQVRSATAPVLADEMRTLVPEPEPLSEPTGDTLILPGAPSPSVTPRPTPSVSSETMIHTPSTPPPASVAPAAFTPDSATYARAKEPIVATPAPPAPPAYQEQATMVAPPPVPVTAPASAPPPGGGGGRRKGLLFGLLGGGAVLAIAAVGAVFALSGGGGDDTDPTTPDASETASSSASPQRSATPRPSPSPDASRSATEDGATETATAEETVTETATATEAPPTATPTTAGPRPTATPVPPTATPTTPPRATFSVSVTGGCSGLSASVTASNVSSPVNIVGTWSGGSTPILPPSASASISPPGGTATFNTGGVGSGTYSFSATADGVPIGSGSATC
jgi:serine/threonine-protein kinase